MGVASRFRDFGTSFGTSGVSLDKSPDQSIERIEAEKEQAPSVKAVPQICFPILANASG
jgi:hypothetical protein